MERELEMKERLYDAAVENKVSTLRELLQKDPLILDRHSLNCQDKNLLHVAALFGNVEFVKEVLAHSPDLCLSGDRFGRIPLHLAVIKGRLPVLQQLIRARPISARERTEGGGNVLHLCVKHNQLEALKVLLNTIKDGDFANRKDDEGMTILHLAICDKQTETIKFLLHDKIVDVNAKNANGRTALDLCGGDKNSEIVRTLDRAGAERGEDISSFDAGNGRQEGSHNIGAKGGNWLYKRRDSLMVVASLIATIAFQAGLNPAGGVWQEDKPGPDPPPHEAGTAVMALKYPDTYEIFGLVNTVAFVSSLSTILILISGLPFKNKLFCWCLMVIMWVAISATALTYGISTVVLRSELDESTGNATPGNAPAYNDAPKRKVMINLSILLVLIVWGGMMLLLLLGNTIRLIYRWLRCLHGMDLLETLRKRGIQSTDQRGIPV